MIEDNSYKVDKIDDAIVIKTFYKESDMNKKEIDEKVKSIDLLLKIEGCMSIEKIKELAFELQNEYDIIYVHRYPTANFITIGVKEK